VGSRPISVIPVSAVISDSSAARFAVVSQHSISSLQTLIPSSFSPDTVSALSLSTVASSYGFSVVLSWDSAGS